MTRPPDDAPEYDDDPGDMIPFLDDPEPAPSGVGGAADGDRFPDPVPADGPGPAEHGPRPGIADVTPGASPEGTGRDGPPRTTGDGTQTPDGSAGGVSGERTPADDAGVSGADVRTLDDHAGHAVGVGDVARVPDGAGGGAGRDGGAGGGVASTPERRAGGDGVEAVEGRRRAVRKLGLLSVGFVAGAVALGVGAVVVLKPYFSPQDFEGTGSGAVTVRITPGSSAASIGSTLEDAGVVASAESFVEATEARSVSDRLRPGHYRLRKGMAATAALDLLLAPASRVVKKVTVPEGLRVSEVLPRVAKATGIPLAEFQAVDKELVGLPSYAKGLEGFLFPATYEVEPGDKAVDVLAAMVERFTQAARHVRLEERAKQVNLTPFEAVTVASLIQAEGGVDDDYPKIARVIYNRLAKDAPLEIDSTVLYAQNRRTLKVSEKDTKVDSPYNTYRYKGLPVGPIANPGEKALVAALQPAKGDWYWFVTTDPAHRITKFTDKESEFVRYREELNKNLGTN